MSAPQTDGSTPVPEITPEALKARLDDGDDLVVVDVREPFERDIADLPDVGQLRIPVGEFLDRMGDLDPDAETVLYCRSGARSGWATQQLLDKGFTRALNLKGGVLGWREAVDPSLRAY